MKISPKVIILKVLQIAALIEVEVEVEVTSDRKSVV